MSRFFWRAAVAAAALAVVLQVALATLRAQSRADSESRPAATTPSPTTASTDAATRPLLGQLSDRIAADELVGKWVTEIAGTRQELVLGSDRRYRFHAASGSYSATGNQLRLMSAGGSGVYEFEIVKSTLALRGGDLRREIKFNRQTTLADYVGNWIDVSPGAIKTKAARLLVVLGIVLAARLIIIALQALSAGLIYSNRAPFKYLYRYNKRRVRTLHLLSLNIVKYMIYFTALGFVLSEIGVDYTAYLASLSVVGLAIGFGSQGLVSDMVTGFFSIFEGQFDVGDLVEVSGQTGVVTEFGLRTTTLRNYLGQTVVIPNRNISVVGNFRLGALQATVDVFVDCPATGTRGLSLVRAITDDVRKEFLGVVLRDPSYEGPVTQEAGACYIRVKLAIWPAQQWVIEQQLIPRIREAFAREKLPNPSDRIVAFYHPREVHKVASLAERLQKRFTWRRSRPDEPTEEKPPPDDIAI